MQVFNESYNSKISFTGPFLFFEIINIREPIFLNEIETSFPDLLGKDQYKLLGAIRYINSSLTQNNHEGRIGMGHYTCVVQRNQEWWEFNDLSVGKERILKSKNDRKIHCELLIYFKSGNQ